MSTGVKMAFKSGEDTIVKLSNSLDAVIGSKVQLNNTDTRTIKGFPVDDIGQTEFLIEGHVEVGDTIILQ